MAVITISRGTLSGGLMLAECVAARLGCRSLGRDALVQRAAVAGIDPDVLRRALEKPPPFLGRVKHSKYIYLCLIQAALSEEVRSGKIVYHGNAGHLLLKDAPVLRVRIVAPMHFRLAMAKERLNLTGQRAIEHIQRMDNERKKWTQYIYGVDWTDPALYDVVLNLEHVTVQEACDVVVELAGKARFALSPEMLERLNDLALASRIRANLATSTSTEDLEVQVVARAGAVDISGTLASRYQRLEVERIARAVPGVKELNVQAAAPSSGA